MIWDGYCYLGTFSGCELLCNFIVKKLSWNKKFISIELKDSHFHLWSTGFDFRKKGRIFKMIFFTA